MQQTQQHMFKQLEQCMQQAYSGLLLGTPVHAKEYTEQFKKNNNTVLQTEMKHLNIVPDQSDWDDHQDFTSHGATASLLSLPADSSDMIQCQKPLHLLKVLLAEHAERPKFRQIQTDLLQ